jgi:RimJ/RimL family protein N-acetyltransferase
MNHQDLFQCLKGVGTLDLSSLALPVNSTGYALYPIKCRAGETDQAVVDMLTKARNDNALSFLTFFTATPERTTAWLTDHVAADRSRILFALKESRTNKLYGYMGLAHGDGEAKKIEGDAIVRYADSIEPGLMRLAFLRLVEWTSNSLGFGEVWVRVLADNPAVEFYKRCGFVSASESRLYEVRGPRGTLAALTESCNGEELPISSRTLIYMKYSLTG